MRKHRIDERSYSVQVTPDEIEALFREAKRLGYDEGVAPTNAEVVDLLVTQAVFADMRLFNNPQTVIRGIEAALAEGRLPAALNLGGNAPLYLVFQGTSS